jgi:uncharacterized protein YegL
MNQQFINTIVVLIVILILWLLFRFLFRKLVEPHKSYVHGPGVKSESNKLGFLATEKRSSGFESSLIDDKKTSNKEVAKVFILEDQNSLEFRNILLIDNSGSTADQMNEYKKALKSFVATQFTGEKNALFTFSDTLKKCCDFTDSKDTLNNAIEAIQPEGATAMNDAIIAAADLIASQELLEKKDGKSIFYNIILFTDGLDNVSQNNKDEVKKRLEGKCFFSICTKDSDLNLMYELSKNPRNVFIIGGSASTQNSALGNASNSTLEEALLKIRNEKMKGRGTVAYIQMKDDNNQYKIRGYVNVLGEIYSCGTNGEGSFFKGLCESPGNDESKIYLGSYVDASRTNEDYLIDSTGPFGNSKTSLPISATCMSAGAWTIYQLNKPKEEIAKSESLLNAFPKVALFSLMLWCPIYLIYWILKFTIDFNLFTWLGKEFEITITQILLFFVIWIIMSTLYVDLLKRKRGFMLFNEGINCIVGTGSLSKFIITLSVIGIVFSVLVFYPFSYVAFFVSTLIGFSANLALTYGGSKTWAISAENPDLIPLFYENTEGITVHLKCDYETAQGVGDEKSFTVKSSGSNIIFQSIEAAALDSKSKNIIDYLENCVHLTSIEKSYDSLSEALMLLAIGSLKDKKIIETNEMLHSPSEIILKKEVSLADKLIFIIALFKEASNEIIFSEDFRQFAYRTPLKQADSPYIFEFEKRNYYHFAYDDNKNGFMLAEPENANTVKWTRI